MITKNKRGDIPITVLVIGVIVICGLAILSFYIANNSAKTAFGNTAIVEKATLDFEKISVYKSLGFQDSEINGIFDIKTDSQGKYFISEQGNIRVRHNVP